MSAHTLGATYYKSGSMPGGNGLVFACGTFTGSAAYDAGGSTLDLSSILGTYVDWFRATTNDADLSCKWVPGSSNAAATMKVFVDNDAGTEKTGNLSGTTFQWFAVGRDA